jgi:hypothetical protein
MLTVLLVRGLRMGLFIMHVIFLLDGVCCSLILRQLFSHIVRNVFFLVTCM